MLLLLACAQASDDDTAVPPSTLGLVLSNVSEPGDLVASDGSTHDIKLAPGILLVHTAAFALFAEGSTIGRPGLEPFGEDGDPTALVAELEGDPDVLSVGWLTARDATSYEVAPMFPGEFAAENVDVSPGDRVTVAAMFGESNDTVLAALGWDPFGGGDALVDGRVPMGLYDLGTEVDEEPGLGADQAPRQSEPGQGEPESVPVARVDGTDGWPSVEGFATLEAIPR